MPTIRDALFADSTNPSTGADSVKVTIFEDISAEKIVAIIRAADNLAQAVKQNNSGFDQMDCVKYYDRVRAQLKLGKCIHSNWF